MTPEARARAVLVEYTWDERTGTAALVYEDPRTGHEFREIAEHRACWLSQEQRAKLPRY